MPSFLNAAVQPHQPPIIYALCPRSQAYLRTRPPMAVLHGLPSHWLRMPTPCPGAHGEFSSVQLFLEALCAGENGVSSPKNYTIRPDACIYDSRCPISPLDRGAVSQPLARLPGQRGQQWQGARTQRRGHAPTQALMRVKDYRYPSPHFAF